MTAEVPARNAAASFERLRDALAAVGRRMTVSGDHIQASCPGPSHRRGDRNPSLAIDYKPADELTVMHCHGKCATEDVLAALGLVEADLFDRPIERRPVAPRRPAVARRRQPAAKPGKLPARLVVPAEPVVVEDWSTVETYRYDAADGSPRIEVTRQHRTVADPDTGETRREKNFPQRYAAPDRPGRWVKRKPAGLVPPLWMLPDVVAAISYGEPVAWTEGEEDAKRLRREEGVCATSNPSGAGGLTAEQAASLTDAGEVWLFGDHDVAGYARLVKGHELLAAVGIPTIRLLVSAVTTPGGDVDDHYDAGHRLADFVELTAAQARHHELVALAEDRAAVAARDLAEVRARVERAASADSPSVEARERTAAMRWMVEVERHAGRLAALRAELDAAGDVDAELVNRMSRASAAAERAQLEAVSLTDDPAADVDDADADDDEDLPPNVVQHPTVGRQAPPGRPLAMSRGRWRYDVGGSDRPRGVYTYLDNQWVKVAPLPYVQARIVRRDGSGRRCGLDYLIAAGEDQAGVIVGHRELRDGSWANLLGLALSDDDKVMKAASTAVRLAAEDVDEREAVPRIGDDGQVAVPVPETLPSGYLVTAPTDQAAGLEAWAEIIQTTAASTRIALTLGASAVAPFVSALRRQSHFVALFGDSDRGKSVTLSLAGGVWGDTLTPGGVLRSWNKSGIGMTRELGSLGILPGIVDEAGSAPLRGPAEWGQVIYNVCEGASRTTAEARGSGVRVSAPWGGIVITAGNGRITHGLGAGKYAGVGKRVVELGTPLTHTADQAERLRKELLPLAYGHAGRAILDRFTVDDVAALIEAAEARIGLPEGGNERTIARHLHSHVAGAAMLDAIAGTGTTLYDAACAAATEYLTEWVAPEHDADRMVSAIRDAMAREPAMWPAVSDYREHRQPYRSMLDQDPNGRPLPQHGVNRSLSGVRADDGSWVAVFSTPWHALADGLDVDESVALRELYDRGILSVTASRRRRREWTTAIKDVGHALYKLVLPVVDDDQDDPAAAATPAAADPEPQAEKTARDPEQVLPAAGAEDAAPPPAVAGVWSVLASPAPCASCGEPASHAVDGTPAHAGGDCLDKLSAARTAPATPAPAESPAPAAAAATAPAEALPAGTYATRDGAPGRADMAGDPQPCLMCGKLGVGVRVDGGHVVHIRCWEGATLAEVEAAAAAAGTSIPNGAGKTTPVGMLAPADAIGPNGAGKSTPVGPKAPAAPPKPARSRASTSPRTPGTPAVFVTADGVVLPDGSSLPLPGQLDHVGHVAQLGYDLDLGVTQGTWTNKSGARQEWREPGQVWVDDAIAARLCLDLAGLPTSPKKRREALADATAGSRAVAAAIADGWSVGGDGDGLRSWTRVWLPDRQGVSVVLRSALDPDLAILAGDPTPHALMRRLARFSEVTGQTFHVSGQSTGIDWIMQSRWRERELLWPARRSGRPGPAGARTRTPPAPTAGRGGRSRTSWRCRACWRSTAAARTLPAWPASNWATATRCTTRTGARSIKRRLGTGCWPRCPTPATCGTRTRSTRRAGGSTARCG